jgi:hypothetical protein
MGGDQIAVAETESDGAENRGHSDRYSQQEETLNGEYDAALEQ